jgi:hypothetical protein
MSSYFAFFYCYCKRTIYEDQIALSRFIPEKVEEVSQIFAEKYYLRQIPNLSMKYTKDVRPNHSLSLS